MQPYYADDHVTLYLGDALDLVEWLDGDVLITDPPYGTGAHGYGRGRGGIANDLDTEVRDAILAAWGDRPALVFGSPRLPDPPGTWADRLVWDKRRPGINGGPWRYRHESIYVTPGWHRVNDSAVSIIEAHPDKLDQGDHIHAKPLALMSRLVAAAPNGVIVDPFAGSGSTLAAAKQLGRKAIGVELEERYCQLAAARLGQDVLFLPDRSEPTDDHALPQICEECGNDEVCVGFHYCSDCLELLAGAGDREDDL